MANNYLIPKSILLLLWWSSPLNAQSVQTIDQLRNKAEVLYSEGDYSKALTYYLKGYQLARQLDPVRAANLTVDISSIYHMQGNYRQGATICHNGTALLKRAATQPDSVWFKLNSSLGEMYKKLNNQDSCYLYFSRANALLQKHPELEKRIAEYVIYHYNNQGMMYVREGAYTEGLSYLTKALSVAERHTTSKEDVAIVYNSLGSLYEELGDFHKALAMRKSAAAIYSKKDLYSYLMYSGITWDALQIRAYREAVISAKRALILADNMPKAPSAYPNIIVNTLVLSHLGGVYGLIGDYKQASKYYNKVIDFYKSHSIDRGKTIADSYLGLAQVEKVQGNMNRSLVFCQQAIIASHHNFIATDLRQNPTPERALFEQSLFEALVLKADLLFRRFRETKKINDLRNACSTYEHALAVADEMRKSYNALETKWFFATQVRAAYVNAVETAYSLYKYTQQEADEERVFRLLERSKAAALADITRESLIKPVSIPADLLTRERQLQRTITAQKLEPTTASSTKLVDAQIQLAQLQQQLEKDFPAYYRAKYQPQTVTVRQVQASLDEHTAYLSYLLTSDALYIAVVTREGLNLVRKTENLRLLKDGLNALDTAMYTNPGLGNYKGTSAAITAYRWLIEPVAYGLKNTKRLIISPDGELHRLPFEVLETGRVVDDFLIKHYAISYVPSANTFLQRLEVATDPANNTLLGLAPFVVPTEPDTPSLAYLPASQTEVEQLPGEALLGQTATKARFMRSYANYDILHFATHAYANNVESARSYIAFYPDGNPDKLYAGEIYNLALPHTRMVMLSACETGSGKLQIGEGVMSLAQAFAYAGCPSIVSTLWIANDESTAYLAQQFYKYLQKGLPIDVALQRTRLDYFRSDLYPKLNHPHYWANLILLGHSQPIYETPWPVARIAAVIIGLVFCVGIVLVIRQRRLAQETLPD